MIEIVDGFFVNPWKVTVIKAADKDSCVLYVSGQSALEGFVLKKPALEAATDIVEAMQEDEETEEEEDDEDDEEE